MPLLEMKGIVKKFDSFLALDHVNLDLEEGEVHALLGENGAGKSTLMNILFGILQPTEGNIYYKGTPLIVGTPQVALQYGISMVHQHFMLVENFTVTENIMLGQENFLGATSVWQKWGLLNRQQARSKIRHLSNEYGLDIDPDAKIENLSVGQQQRVEILKGLYRNSQILILDEPTAVLTPQEIDDLLTIIENLRMRGKSILIITHKLKEIRTCAQRLTIIRRGKNIQTVDPKQIDEKMMAELMVGRPINLTLEKKEVTLQDVSLKVENICVRNNKKLLAVNNLSFELRQGEILGIAGVDGNGQSELIEALTGLRHTETGKILLYNGSNMEDVTNKNPRSLYQHGMTSIPEDRQRRGLVLDFSIRENLILQNHRKEPFSHHAILDPLQIDSFAQSIVQRYDIRPPKTHYKAKELSGGNQQKVILAREINQNPEVLIAAQPTRGLDVGAIEFMHQQLLAQRNKNKAVLLISYELDELLTLADRIIVLYQGCNQGELEPTSENHRKIGLLMAGGVMEDKKI